jgi:hypothetical protein
VWHAGSDEDQGRSRRLGALDREWSSRDQVTLCAVYTVHKEMRSASFLV